jgi:hypothetical protein
LKKRIGTAGESDFFGDGFDALCVGHEIDFDIELLHLGALRFAAALVAIAAPIISATATLIALLPAWAAFALGFSTATALSLATLGATITGGFAVAARGAAVVPTTRAPAAFASTRTILFALVIGVFVHTRTFLRPVGQELQVERQLVVGFSAHARA